MSSAMCSTAAFGAITARPSTPRAALRSPVPPSRAPTGSAFARSSRVVIARAAQDSPDPEVPVDRGDTEGLIGTIGVAALWAGLVYYAAMVAPNQTPLRDQYFIEKLINLGVNDGVNINAVFYSVFNFMGIYPIVFSSLILPSGRSGNKVPAWPFLTGSFAFGAFALLPYFALWKETKVESPPPKEELNFFMKGSESLLLPLGLLGGSIFLWYNALSAGIPAWNAYFKLFDESRFVHITTIDFAILTASVPFWMYNDASARNWEGRDTILPFLCLLPVVGPTAYLCLRPKSGDSDEA